MDETVKGSTTGDDLENRPVASPQPEDLMPAVPRREWTDADLYKKYKLTNEEIAFIEKMIRPMGEADE